MKISYSKIMTFLECNYKYNLRYEQKLKPKVFHKSMYFGSDLHKLLETNGLAKQEIKDKFDSLSSQEQEKLQSDYIENLFTIYDDYKFYNPKHPAITELKFGAYINVPPQTMTKHFPPNIEFNGVVDAIDGDTLIEYKTFSQKPTTQFLEMSSQRHIYSWVLNNNLLDYKIKYIKWMYISSKLPSEPELLKNGKLSEKKSQNITEKSWERACKKHNIIQDCPDHYKSNIDNFIFETTFPFEKDVTDNYMHNFGIAIPRLLDNRNSKLKTITKNCNYCEYRDICYTELCGNDVDYLINRDFVRGDVQC